MRGGNFCDEDTSRRSYIRGKAYRHVSFNLTIGQVFPGTHAQFAALFDPPGTCPLFLYVLQMRIVWPFSFSTSFGSSFQTGSSSILETRDGRINCVVYSLDAPETALTITIATTANNTTTATTTTTKYGGPFLPFA